MLSIPFQVARQLKTFSEASRGNFARLSELFCCKSHTIIFDSLTMCGRPLDPTTRFETLQTVALSSLTRPIPSS